MCSTAKHQSRIEVLLSDLRRSTAASGAAVKIHGPAGDDISIEGNRAGLFRLGLDLAWWSHRHPPSDEPQAELLWPKGECSYVDYPSNLRVMVQESVSEELSQFVHTSEKYRRQSTLMVVVLIWLPLLFWCGVGVLGIVYLASWILRLFA